MEIGAFFLAFLIVSVFALLVAPASVSPSQGDCCQPSSDGERPTSRDALFVLRASVGASPCEPCVCDADGSGSIAATDALTCLRASVGIERDLKCSCLTTTTTPTTTLPPAVPACTSVLIRSLPGSQVDTGWTGHGHDQALIEGAEVTFAIVGRCADEPSAACRTAEECPSGPCLPCDCDDPNDSVCNVAGPTGPGNCKHDLRECRTNADCGPGGDCSRMFGPPLPLIAAGVPACVATFFREDLAGTVDFVSGEGEAATFLRSRVYLGITSEKPCPRCGELRENPRVGQRFTCNGGPRDGAACTVEAVSPVFGGVSTHCPPAQTASVSGEGLAIRLHRITTARTQKTATMPCVVSGYCMDGEGTCSTNADCRRCTGDLAVCVTNADCAEEDRCAPAPEQPIACGMWCHCGFCDNDPSQPCFDDSECDEGEICTTGDTNSGMHDQPNTCADLVCGRSDPEQCCAPGDRGCAEHQETPLEGTCETKPYLSCSDRPGAPLFGECDRQDAGACVLERRSCFEHVIAREGEPSPKGLYCLADADPRRPCGGDEDCEAGGCTDDAAAPTVAALFCIPKTASPAINASAGLPGPGALFLKTAVVYCRCGDGEVGCDEECDDGNAAADDGCTACRNE
jgi:hypothetical protein